MSENKILLEVTEAQADAIKVALDVYSRLCIGQIDIIADMVRDETIPMASASDRVAADIDTADTVKALADAIKAALGYPSSGSMGIGNKHVHVTGHRAWEVRKVLAKELASHRHPVGMRGVDHDGLLVRYTADPAPKATLITPPCAGIEDTGEEDLSEGNCTLKSAELDSTSLALVLEMAQEHVNDIESGIKEGNYGVEDNANIADKRAAVESVGAFHSALIAVAMAGHAPAGFLN